MENIFFLNPKNHATALPTVWMRFIGLASAIDSMNFKLFCLSKVWSLLYTLSHMLSISFEVWIIDPCCVDSKWGRTSCLKTCLVFKVWLSCRLIHWMDVSALLPVHQGLSSQNTKFNLSLLEEEFAPMLTELRQWLTKTGTINVSTKQSETRLSGFWD